MSEGILNIVQIIKYEVNRMGTTYSLNELDEMALRAKKSIEELQAMRRKEINAEQSCNTCKHTDEPWYSPFCNECYENNSKYERRE